jgi:hypothetical protein
MHDDTPSPTTTNGAVVPARPYHAPGHVGFLPGNPGRPKGALNKRRQSAIDLMDARGFDPLHEKITLCELLKQRVLTGTFDTSYDANKALEMYSEALRDVLQYRYQRLRAVEHVGQLELIQKLQSLDGMNDAELRALLAEAKEITRQLPPRR